MCCDPWGRKQSDTIERLNCTELNVLVINDDIAAILYDAFLFSFLCVLPCVLAYLVAQQ